MSKLSYREQRVLGYINRVRAKFGLKPRKTIAKGVRTQPKSCPIANSIGLGCSVTNAYVEVNGRRVYHPAYAEKFIESFDQGRKPKFNLNG
jgi:hypothetical protein